MKVNNSQLLEWSYQNVTKKGGLIDFTQEIRGPENTNSGKYELKANRLSSLFDPLVWEEIKKTGGHKKFQHKITKTVVEYKNHGNEGNLDPGAAVDILDKVQEVINILGNEVFGYTEYNWKKKPDYKKAVKNLNIEPEQSNEKATKKKSKSFKAKN